jgi:ADP-heptose:LPS heptosyltransferase
MEYSLFLPSNKIQGRPRCQMYTNEVYNIKLNMSRHQKRVLILSLSGIGNFLMQSPTWQQLKRRHPKWHLTLWVAPRGTHQLAAADPAIDGIIEASIKASLLRHAIMVRRLRAQKFDIGVVMAPGQLLKSAAYLYLAGIPRRVGHAYRLGANEASAFLLTDPIEEMKGNHDIEQNMELLTPLDSGPRPQAALYALDIPLDNKQRAKTIIAGLKVAPGATFIGLHAGSAPNFSWKRWPLRNFGIVGRALIEQYGAHILIFGGPEEEVIKQELKRSLGGSASIMTADLITVAALMRHCRLVITNDSGLMHVAAAAGTRTLGIFGPTDERRVGPRGLASHTIRAPHTEPVYDVNTNFNLGPKPHPTLVALAPAQVLDKISLISNIKRPHA